MACPPKQHLHSLFSILLLLLLPLFGSGADPLGNYCSDGAAGGYGHLSANINRVLKDLVSKASAKGFATSSAGDAGSPGQVFGLAQCRRDISDDDCKSCLADAALQLPKVCTNQTDARIWYDYCFLRYATKEFAGEVDTGVGVIYFNVANVTDPKKFEGELGDLMDKVRAQAVALPASQGLGKGQKKLSPLETLYALAQCTQDLPPLGCAQCVAIAEGVFGDGICSDRKGCRVLYSSCYLRYELYPFFFPLDRSTNSEAASDASATSRALIYPSHP